jgi:hypothetical protein
MMPTNLISSSPRGEEQLRKFDMPAYQRRNVTLSATTISPEISEEHSHETAEVQFNGATKH